MRTTPLGLRVVKLEISRFPCKERPYMPGSTTTPGVEALAMTRPIRVAFRMLERRRHPEKITFAAQWLAYTLPCRRFADILADAYARLGADVDRYSFIAMDFHHLLLAGLPAHTYLIFRECTAMTARKSCQIGHHGRKTCRDGTVTVTLIPVATRAKPCVQLRACIARKVS